MMMTMKKKVMLAAVALGMGLSMAVSSPALAAGSDGVVLGVAKVVVKQAAFKSIKCMALGPLGVLACVGSFCVDAYNVSKAACDTIF